MLLPADTLIAKEKLTDYLLVERPVGDKSRFLARAGYNLDNWRVLENDLRRLLTEDAVSVETNRYGEYFEIRGSLKGPNGVTLTVRSIWTKETKSRITKFITLYPDRRS